jgi:integrase
MKLPAFPLEVKKNNSIVRIYRHENSGYDEFKLAYYLNGKRKFETFSDYSRAKKRADEINDSVTDGNLEGLTLSKEECILYRRSANLLDGLSVKVEMDTAAKEYVDAKKILGSLSLIEAAKEYAKRHPATMKKTLVSEAYRNLVKDKRADGASEVYLKDLEIRLGKFSESFGGYVSDLDAEKINEFLRSLHSDEKNKIGARSRNNYRRAIGTLIHYAEAKNALPRDSIRLKDIIRVNEAQSDVEIFTPDEMIKLLSAAQLNPENLKPGFNRRYASGPGLLPRLLLGGFAGMRSAEISRQKWSDINLASGFIRVTAAKGNTAQKRLIPIHDNLRKWLLTCWQNDGLCSTHARHVDALMRLAERAGVKWKHNALRHSYASYRVAEVQNVPQVALESGNSVRVINRHYRELVTPEAAKAWFAIEPGAAKILRLPNAA